MRKYSMLLIIFFITSCHKEQITIYYTYLKNISTHKVVIKPYFSGTIPPDKIITLFPSEVKEIAHGSERGLNTGGFYSSYIAGSDSVIIYFDDIYAVSHYFQTPSSFNRRYHLYSSDRNIGNYHSFLLNNAVIKKWKWENKYYYEFTDQDFLFAQ